MADRYRVGCRVHNADQWYARETEEKRDGKWTAIPFFVLRREEARVMPKDSALSLINKLRSMRQFPWLEDMTGKHIDIQEAEQQSIGDSRRPVRATLDDENSPDAAWYVLKPVNRPNGGPMWLLKCVVPGVMEPQLIFEKDPISCLQRAQDLNFLSYGERAPSPDIPKPEVKQAAPVAMIRPGSRY